ncbi:MFS transporter [Deinococcus maricopensis]|uniref:Major facilitator superfamily MFS_1 n=1 Tax=Deinococcus maricopensis (strain DSM 21211 / LMG 22137 / NRRL B-23946 / LB-34) TaxID=709986 RepID=E8U356_DEIML|nr:MFS transporter [Deinococcus maricopensis]ADV66001.1 major facilitator superfamily MFS_1 [Deinococcus maricopensis DSM 21211]
MPPALLALAISAFAIGTTEFVIVGLLNTIVADLHTTIPTTGLLVSGYALGVAVGAPILTALTGRLPRKSLLMSLMALFTAANVLAAFADHFTLLLAARLLSAVAHGVFFAIGSTIAAGLVTPEKRASAIATMFAGLTLATALGVPAGTWIGQQLGWRATFWVIAALGALAVAATSTLLPCDLPRSAPARLTDQANVLIHPRLLLVFAMTALGYGGTFVTFTYLGSVLEHLTGFSADMVSVLLLVYGVAIALGNVLGGRVADRHPVRALTALFLAQAAVLLAFTFTAPHAVPAVITLFLMGALAFANVPGLQVYVVQLATRFTPGGVDVASALNIAAFNLGIALGAFVGGLIVQSPLGLGATPWVGAVFVTGGLLLTLLSGRLDRHRAAPAATD